MAIKRILFFLSFSPFLLFSQNQIPFQVGEKCTYRIHYGPITAAYGTLSVNSLEKHNNFECFYFKGVAETNTFFDYIFKVYDEYISYVESDSLFPNHFVRNVNEGGHIIKQNYLFNNKKKQVLAKDSIYKIPNKTQDMLSAFYFTRAMLNQQNVKKDSVLKINIFMDEENYPMKIKYLKNETIKTKWGKINCMVFLPQLQVGRIFKKEEEMKIWISDDNNKVMIKVETKVIVGVIKAELFSFEGLKNPLSITD